MGLAALIFAIGGPIMGFLEMIGVDSGVAGSITTALATPLLVIALVALLPIGLISNIFGF